MKKLKTLIFLFWLWIPIVAISQTQWVSYHYTIPTANNEGCNFKFSARVRMESRDTSSRAHLWVRVDKDERSGFFDNMAKRPIRSSEWKNYIIEGVIDSNSTLIAFGARVYFGGKFFYDNFQLDIETKSEGWKTVFKNDFEDGQIYLTQGIGKGTSGIDTSYTAIITQTESNKFLKIEARDAIETFREVELYQKEDTNKVNTLFKIAGLHNSKNEIQMAEDYLEKALHLSQKLNYESGEIRYFEKMGDLYSKGPAKNYNLAEEHYKRGLEYSQRKSSSLDIILFTKKLLNIYLFEGNTLEEQRYTYIQLKEYELLKDTTGMSECYNSLGVYMRDQKNYSEALRYYKLAIKMREESNEKNFVGQTSVNIGDLYAEMGHLDSAMICINKAIDIYTGLGKDAVSWGLPMSYLILANINLKKGEINIENNEETEAQSNFNEALTYYIKSQKLYREQYSSIVANRVNVQIGIAYYKLNNFIMADSFINSGLNLIEKSGFTNMEEVSLDKRDAYLYLYKIDSIQGNWEEANINFLNHIAISDKLIKNENAKLTTTYQLQYEFDKKEAAIKAEQDRRELALQKDLELKALNFEYERKQSAAKSEKEKQQLKYEQQLKQQQIEAEYAQKTAKINAEQEKKDAINASALALSQHEINRKNQEQKFFIIGLILLFALLGFIIYGYFQKQKANTLLQQQKDEIDTKSQELEKSLKELKSAQAQLIQSEKMASLGELTAGIAHEIQNPLNFVNNFSEVSIELIDEVMEEVKAQGLAPQQTITEILSDIQTNLTKINHHGKRADAIVKGMLEHSRTSSGERVPTDMNSLCDEYLRLSYHGLRAKDKSFNAAFETNFDLELPKINVVPQDLGRVLLNLINNAFYAVKTQDLASPPEPEYKPIVIVSTKNLGDRIEISVKDNGNGIPEHIKDKIFQPFFTTKPTGQGTGLGLSLSYDIVKAHGGEIKVNSKENEGTEFTIQLPIFN